MFVTVVAYIWWSWITLIVPWCRQFFFLSFFYGCTHPELRWGLRHNWSLLQVPWLESCRRWRSVDYLANLWSGSSFGMIPATAASLRSAKKRKWGRGSGEGREWKQLPMLSKPQLSNVPFQRLHRHTWKGGTEGVTFGRRQRVFGVSLLSQGRIPEDHSARPFARGSTWDSCRERGLPSVAVPLNKACEGFFFSVHSSLRSQYAGRRTMKIKLQLLWNIHTLPASDADWVQGRHEFWKYPFWIVRTICFALTCPLNRPHPGRLGPSCYFSLRYQEHKVAFFFSW